MDPFRWSSCSGPYGDTNQFGESSSANRFASDGNKIGPYGDTNQFGESSSANRFASDGNEIGTQGSNNLPQNYFSYSNFVAGVSNSIPINNVNNFGVPSVLGHPGNAGKNIFGEKFFGMESYGQYQQEMYTGGVQQSLCETGGVPGYYDIGVGNTMNIGAGERVENVGSFNDDDDDDDDDDDYIEEEYEVDDDDDYEVELETEEASYDAEALKAFNFFDEWCKATTYVSTIKNRNVEHIRVPKLRRFDMSEEDNTLQLQSRDRWIIPGMPSFDPPPRHSDEYIDPADDCQLAIGSTFSTKNKLYNKVVLYHLENKRRYRITKSDSRWFWMKCNIKECKFKLRASGTDSLWRVYKMVEHSCQFNPNHSAPPSLPSKQLGEIMSEKILVKGQIMVPEAVRTHLRVDHGLQVSYGLARRIRNHAISTLYGNEDESFKMIPSFLFMLRQMNPGSITDYMVVPATGQFRYAFYALGLSIAGFNYARPFMVIDGTHLKSKYRGILFVAATKDENNQIYPLAFGIGGVECQESWTWFLQRVKGAFNCPEGMLIVSDQSPAIARAVTDVFPNAHHGLCCYHIQKNLATYGHTVVNLFKAAAYSYTMSGYNRHMKDLENTCLPAYRHLKEVIGEKRFARVHCPVRRLDIMTSNVVESLNSVLLWARRLPVCSVFEVARSLVEAWFAKRYKSVVESRGPLTEYATEKLLCALNEGEQMKVTYQSETTYTVRHMRKEHTVVLGQQACTCKKFQHDLIPCPHAAAVIRYINHDPTAYVGEHFKVEHLREMWQGIVVAVPHPSEWIVPSDVRNAICEVPDNPRQAGRPRERRYPSGPEGSVRSRRVQKCSRCGGTGHNSKRCNIEIRQNFEDNDTNTVRSQRARKKCRICGIEGHTAPRCPQRQGFDMNFPPNY